VTPGGGDAVWIYDFGLDYGRDLELQADRVRRIFQDAFGAAWRGTLENDGFNRLVLRAQLTWREVGLLRAIAQYLRHAGTTYRAPYWRGRLARCPERARLRVELFRLRYEPPRREERDGQVRQLVAAIEARLDAIASLDEDRIMRGFLIVIQGMLRT